MTEPPPGELALAEQTLWRFLNGYQPDTNTRARWLLVMGCADIRVAECSARLVLQGRAERVLFSGGFGRLSRHQFRQTEAEVFASQARSMGVPATAMELETQAGNTAENIRNSLPIMLADNHTARFEGAAHRAVDGLIVACRNIYRPRVAATLGRWYPAQLFDLVSPALSWESFCYYSVDDQHRQDQLAQLRGLMVGEIHRLVVYSQRQWIQAVDLPTDVMAAYDILLQAGYDAALA